MRPVSITRDGIRYDESQVASARRHIQKNDPEMWSIAYMATEMRKLIDSDIHDRGPRPYPADDAMTDDPPPALGDPQSAEASGQNNEEDYDPDDRVPRANPRRMLPRLREIYTPDYGLARRDLIEQLGQYCCYCESPIGSSLAVEHRLPKAAFPELAYAWSNFLIACDSCNSAKGMRPNHEDTDDGSRQPKGSIDAFLELDDVANYAWPHKIAEWKSDGAPTPRPVVIELYYLNGGKHTEWHQWMDEEMVAKFLAAFRAGTIHVEDGYVHRFNGDQVRLGAAVVPNPELSKIDRQAVQRMIDLVGLNTLRVNKTHSIDRRVELRTLAMLTAMTVRDNLATVFQRRNADEITGWERVVSDLIRATGFWSVWVQVFPQVAHRKINSIFPNTRDRLWF